VGGGESLMHAADAISAFEQFSMSRRNRGYTGS